MRQLSYLKAALWGGTVLLALNALLVIAIETCNYFTESCGEHLAALTRVSRVTHPIAERLYVEIVLAFFDAGNRVLHQWNPTRLEYARDAVVFYGLCLLEAFFYGLILGFLVRVLLPWVTRPMNLWRG
ncbi:MAG: hypothetical protein AB7P12_07435 [Alphaproteobacteria bacterium]